jgi:hypothetical protein
MNGGIIRFDVHAWNFAHWSVFRNGNEKRGRSLRTRWRTREADAGKCLLDSWSCTKNRMAHNKLRDHADRGSSAVFTTKQIQIDEVEVVCEIDDTNSCHCSENGTMAPGCPVPSIGTSEQTVQE